jgi:hypothetical protein
MPNLPPRSSALAQSVPEDNNSSEAPPPNEKSPWILFFVQDPEVLMLYLNLNIQPLPLPEEQTQQ